MPRLLQHIDKIAREKQRDVLFFSFAPEVPEESLMDSEPPDHFYSEFRNDKNRTETIKWLDENNIYWVACGHVASECGWQSYAGNIYVDVPWDTNDEKFVLLANKFEDENGNPRNPLVKLWCVSLEVAMKNAHHDESGFWEKWAENF